MKMFLESVFWTYHLLKMKILTRIKINNYMYITVLKFSHSSDVTVFCKPLFLPKVTLSTSEYVVKEDYEGTECVS